MSISLQSTATLQFGTVVNIYDNIIDANDQIIVQVEGYIEDGCTLLSQKAGSPVTL